MGDDPLQQLTQLYSDFGPLLLAYFRRRRPLAAAADDLLQDTFVRAARHPERLWQATLVRLSTRVNSANLPKMLGFFEPSADGKTLLLGGTEGEVCVHPGHW